MALQRPGREGNPNYAHKPALWVQEGGPWFQGPSLSTQMPEDTIPRLVHLPGGSNPTCPLFSIIPCSCYRHILLSVMQMCVDLSTNMCKAQLSIHLWKHKLAKNSIAAMVCRKDIGNAYCYELFNPQPEFSVTQNNWELADFKKYRRDIKTGGKKEERETKHNLYRIIT